MLLNELHTEEVGRLLREPAPAMSRKRRDTANLQTLHSPSDEPHVEFFNPEIKSTLEAKDELIKKQTGSKGAAPGGDSWIWLTSYSRIPVSEEFLNERLTHWRFF